MFVGVFLFLLAADGAAAGRARGSTRPFRQVRSTQGVARGYLASRPPHYAYLGLPYARAPTPQHRFKAPEPPPSWDGIFEGTHRVKCSQDGTGDENCLVLNVFTPPDGADLPVLVLVHDGQFRNGWGAYRPPARLLARGLIIVTFNYRLGIFGFLCLGTPEAPGNAGLKDQVAALYWVQRNIASFGGNPADVTVYGIGTGAICVHLLLLSGLTEGLFHKVVLESGSALSPHTLNYEPISLAFNAAVNLGYEGSENLTELVGFFVQVPAKKLSNISDIFLPCLESYENNESLLEWDALEVLKKGSFLQVPIIMMYSDQDGVSVINKNMEQFTSPPESYEDLLPDNLVFRETETRLRIGQYFKEFYFDDESKPTELIYTEYLNDILYEYPIIKSAVLHAEQSTAPIFVLKFTFDQKTSNENTHYRSISGLMFSEETLEEDEEICERLNTVICNFIKLGDPTPITTSNIPLIWQSLQEYEGVLKVKTAPILVFGQTLTMVSAGTNQRLAFWDHVYENFYKSFAPIHDDTK